MKINDGLKHTLVRRMRSAVANPPERVFARELLDRGLSANEVHRLVVLDPAFDSVPYAFRVAVAGEARRLERERLLDGARRGALSRRAMPA
jgi:hypothetical protein